MHSYIVNQETGTVNCLSKDKVLFFGINDFYDKIVNGDCCFICGCTKEAKIFNNEHIIPKWVLKRFDLYNKQITLPNGAFIKYSQYTLPCCQECNTELGEKVEVPISELLKNPYDQVINELRNSKILYQKLFKWICLIFLKTHLKDIQYNVELDLRKNDGKIGNMYRWADFHHIHCMSRIHHTNPIVDFKVYGSILILPAITYSDVESFDYMDSPRALTSMIQIGDVCIIAVLNDSGAAQTLFKNFLDKITGYLNRYQIIEIFTHMSFLNINLKDRPKYISTITKFGYEIEADVPPKPELFAEDDELIKFGELLYHNVHKHIPKEAPNRDQIIKDIKEGKRQFLFDEYGNFLQS